DVRIANRERFVHGLAFHPLGGERGGSNRRPATERLELGVLDNVGRRIHLDLQLHNVAAFWGTHQTGAHLSAVLVERTHIARVRVVVQNLVAVSLALSPQFQTFLLRINVSARPPIAPWSDQFPLSPSRTTATIHASASPYR